MLRSILLIILTITGLCSTATATETLNLSEAIAVALQNNPDITSAQSLEQSARERVKSSRAEFLPKASTSYSYTRLDNAPFQTVGGIRRNVGDRDQVHWDVTLTQPLFTGFALSARYTMDQAGAKAREIALEKARQDVVRDVKSAYFEALLARRIETVARDKVTALAAQGKDAQDFYDGGVIPKNDLLKSTIALSAALQQLEKARADALIALSRLAMVMGRSLSSDPDLVPVEHHVTAPADLSLLLDEGLQNRPELIIMALNREQAEQSIRLKQSAYYPEIALVGRYEQNGDDPGARTNDYTNDHNSSVSVRASWTFFEWGRSRAEVAGSRHELRSLEETIRAMQDRVSLEIRQEYLNQGVWEKNIKTAGNALSQAKENVRITRLQYLQHVTTATEVLDAQSDLSRAESDYHKALYGSMIAAARLDHALGRRIIQEPR